MELKFESELGQRLHRYFCGVTLTDNVGDALWWNFDHRRWESIYATPDCHYGTHAPCRTLKAFKRMLRKHPEIQGRAILCNRYRGYDVYSQE